MEAIPNVDVKNRNTLHVDDSAGPMRSSAADRGIRENGGCAMSQITVFIKGISELLHVLKPLLVEVTIFVWAAIELFRFMESVIAK
jgi:hypothetical protein